MGLYGGHAQTLGDRRKADRDAPQLLAELLRPAAATLSYVIPRSQLHQLEGAANHAGRRGSVVRAGSRSAGRWAAHGARAARGCSSLNKNGRWLRGSVTVPGFG